MKTLVLGVWYPSVEKYADDYFGSLRNQTDPDFDVLIITDKSILSKKYINDKVTCIEAPLDSTPASIRAFGIDYAKQNKYEGLIFSDCDDYFSGERIEKSKKGLAEADFFANNLSTVTDNKQLIRDKIFKINGENFSFLDILKCNYFGLSNTAVKVSSIPDGFYIPSHLKAVDWWIFSILLLVKLKFIFDENQTTYYRQHCANTVGMDDVLTEGKLLAGLMIKIQHYEEILLFCQRMRLYYYQDRITDELNGLASVLKLTEDSNFKNEYLKVVNKNYQFIKKGWWSEILSMKEWGNYV